MKVLLVHSGSQSTEQTYADREAHFRELVKYISTDHRPLTLESVSDEQTAYALDGLSTSTETAAVVFASNALLSHHVRMAAEEHRAEIETYISKGGGVLVLHQNTPPSSCRRCMPHRRGQRSMAGPSRCRPHRQMTSL